METTFPISVSIIVVNYNTFQLTCDCIESIQKHVEGMSCEVIVVDNASTECDPCEFVARFPFVLLVRSGVNAGFAGGNNLGIAAASGEYILLLNSDAMLLNNVCHILRDFLVRHRSVAIATAQLEYPDGALQHNCQRFPSIKYSLFELFRLQKIFPRKLAGKILLGYFFDHRSIVFPDWVWGTCMMFKRSLVDKFPERKLPDNYFMYCEDIQWCMEVKRLGYRVGFEPSARICHLMGQSGGEKKKLLEQNMISLIDEYYSPLHGKVIRILESLLVQSGK